MYRTILVPLDGSELSEQALPMAVNLSRQTSAKLFLVRSAWIHRIADVTPAETEIRAVKEAEDYLATIATRLSAEGLVVDTGVPFAPAAEGILMEADLRHADLIVMSTHGRSGFSRMMYGSVAEAVLAHSHVPILLVRVTKERGGGEALPAQPDILVPLDGSPFAETALPFAQEMAHALNGRLVLMRVIVPPPQWVDPMVVVPYPNDEIVARDEQDATAYLANLKEQLEAEDYRVETVIKIGPASDTILQECQDQPIKLVVIATHGRTGFARALFGSVAISVLHHGDLPLLLVRPKGLHPEVLPGHEHEVGERVLEHA